MPSIITIGSLITKHAAACSTQPQPRWIAPGIPEECSTVSPGTRVSRKVRYIRDRGYLSNRIHVERGDVRSLLRPSAAVLWLWSPPQRSPSVLAPCDRSGPLSRWLSTTVTVRSGGFISDQPDREDLISSLMECIAMSTKWPLSEVTVDSFFAFRPLRTDAPPNPCPLGESVTRPATIPLMLSPSTRDPVAFPLIETVSPSGAIFATKPVPCKATANASITFTLAICRVTRLAKRIFAIIQELQMRLPCQRIDDISYRTIVHVQGD